MAIVPPGVARGRADAWERTMRNVWVLAVCVCAALGCGDDVSSVPRLSCSQLMWSCGTDDYGTSCGSCSSGRSCNLGRCENSACALSPYASCVVGAVDCCGPTPSGSPTFCSTINGIAYCAPTCTTDEYCDALASTSGRWRCGVRGDGLQVCAPR